jgi:hypothetical protein
LIRKLRNFFEQFASIFEWERVIKTMCHVENLKRRKKNCFYSVFSIYIYYFVEFLIKCSLILSLGWHKRMLEWMMEWCV